MFLKTVGLFKIFSEKTMIHIRLWDYFGSGIFFPDFSLENYSVLSSLGGEAELASFDELFS